MIPQIRVTVHLVIRCHAFCQDCAWNTGVSVDFTVDSVKRAARDHARKSYHRVRVEQESSIHYDPIKQEKVSA